MDGVRAARSVSATRKRERHMEELVMAAEDARDRTNAPAYPFAEGRQAARISADSADPMAALLAAHAPQLIGGRCVFVTQPRCCTGSRKYCGSSIAKSARSRTSNRIDWYLTITSAAGEPVGRKIRSVKAIMELVEKLEPSRPMVRDQVLRAVNTLVISNLLTSITPVDD